MPRLGVVIFPGTNCDHDTYYVVKELAGFDTSYIWHEDTNLNKYHVIILSGGFSYGDYLRPGAIARFSPVMEAIREYADKEKGIVIGICNGFQVLTEAGLLPGALTRNIGLKFLSMDVKLEITNSNTSFTNLFERGEIITLPIAHMDGRFVIDKNSLSLLYKNNQIFLKYSGENPNGSMDHIAGIANMKFNVFGLMPHPERNAEKLMGSGDGIRFFKSLLEWLK